MKMLAASYLKCKQPDLLGGSSLVKGATFTSKLRGPMILASEESHASYGSVNLAWLSLVSGCIDVLSFIALKDLFASAMTGNTALLALAMSRGDWLAASRSLSALLAFGLGVAVGTLIYPSKHQSTRIGIRWLLVLELIFLTGCSILWSASSRPLEGSTLYAVIVLLALSM